eukprot:3194237-Pleurochrysis_carterae.AAC.1
MVRNGLLMASQVLMLRVHRVLRSSDWPVSLPGWLASISMNVPVLAHVHHAHARVFACVDLRAPLRMCMQHILARLRADIVCLLHTCGCACTYSSTHLRVRSVFPYVNCTPFVARQIHTSKFRADSHI